MLDIVDCNNTGPGEELGTYTSLQGGRFVLSRSNPLEIGLKLHYQVKKQLFSAQNGGRK